MTVLTAAIPLAICVLLEFISPRTRYRLKDRFPGSLFIIFLPVFAVLTAIPIQALLRYAGVDPIANLSAVGIVGVLFVTIVLKDFLNYWQHRFDHWALWPIHSVHHSQTDLHAANGYAHPISGVFGNFVHSCPSKPYSGWEPCLSNRAWIVVPGHLADDDHPFAAQCALGAAPPNNRG